MNVYDFDETILKGDSEIYFFKYALKHKLVPFKARLTIRHNLILEKIKINHKHLFSINKTRLNIYHSLKDIKDLDNVLENFWDEHIKYIKDFYYKNQKEDDVIISATPDFILKPIIKRLNIKYLIATPFNLHTFEIIGEYNHKEFKVLNFYKAFEDGIIDEFYSDSNNDRFLAMEAKKAYKVKDNIIEEWKF